ncbi:uncharacterized protein LOC108904565 [Anoplophora glabripennis]|uniref:uncharacterized protein LOC108904565 n=1 Tax=Anoplophora glabripennis TaxID=217634 RepID=UPI0008757896|nr:uncharacterized protein LOC108904565 [Anoplophora glabripennis]
MMKILILIAVAAAASASPIPGGKEVSERVLYDQRQQGELNVRADLKNFMILIIPTPSVPNASNTATLLDLLSKSLPSRPHLKRIKPTLVPTPDAAEETQHFIEAKSAPYHVDITKTKEQLAKLRPGNEEILLATSPNIALVKSGSDSPSVRMSRSSRAYVFTAPTEEEYTVTKTEDVKKVVKKDGKKFMKEAPTKHTLELLGAENEQCGPEMERDSKGICRTSKTL